MREHRPSRLKVLTETVGAILAAVTVLSVAFGILFQVWPDLRPGSPPPEFAASLSEVAVAPRISLGDWLTQTEQLRSIDGALLEHPLGQQGALDLPYVINLSRHDRESIESQLRENLLVLRKRLLGECGIGISATVTTRGFKERAQPVAAKLFSARTRTPVSADPAVAGSPDALVALGLPTSMGPATSLTSVGRDLGPVFRPDAESDQGVAQAWLPRPSSKGLYFVRFEVRDQSRRLVAYRDSRTIAIDPVSRCKEWRDPGRLTDRYARPGVGSIYGDPQVLGRPVARVDFEKGFLGASSYQAVARDRIRVVTNSARQGRYAARFEVRRGDDPINSVGDRAELSIDTLDGEGDERWYAWSVMIARDYPDRGGWNILTQWPSLGTVGPPPLALQAGDGKLLLVAQKQRRDGSLIRRAVIWSGPQRRGQWRDLLMRVRWSGSDSTGSIELWVDGVHQTLRNRGFRYRTRTLVPGYRNYMKIGILRSSRSHSGVALFDDVRVFSEQ